MTPGSGNLAAVPISYGLIAVEFVLALALATLLTPLVRRLATFAGAVDLPDGARKHHLAPMPRMGGVAILAAYFACAYGVLATRSDPRSVEALALLRHVTGPTLLVLALGVADDKWNLGPAVKVVVQLIAGLWLCTSPELRIHILSNPLGADPIGVLEWLAIPLTLAWVLLVTNSFNIVDGMDGLASGVAFVATACLFVASTLRVDAFVPLLLAPMGGAILGFLRYNFNPASIFLGDSGSLSLGFLIAAFSLAGHFKSSTAIAIAAPLLTVALPVLETMLSMTRRFLSGRSMWSADDGHIHHQLLRRGLSARRAAILLYLASAAFGAASLLLVDASRVVVGIVTIGLGAVAWLGVQQLGYSELTEVGYALKRGFFYQRRIIQNSILARKLAEGLAVASSLDDAWPMLVDVADKLGFARVDLHLGAAPPAAAADPAADLVCLRSWVTDRPERLQAEGFRTISVHLSGTGPIGRLDLCRAREEGPLHSELGVFLDVAADALPSLLAAAARASA